MSDIPPRYWIGLPLFSLAVCVAVAVVSPELYKWYIRKHEVGALEHGTVLCLVPAVILGVLVFRRRHELPGRWLGWWALLITLGALYFAGEECSWGQNYFGWGTPEYWSRVKIGRAHV